MELFKIRKQPVKVECDFIFSAYRNISLAHKKDRLKETNIEGKKTELVVKNEVQAEKKKSELTVKNESQEEKKKPELVVKNETQEEKTKFFKKSLTSDDVKKFEIYYESSDEENNDQINRSSTVHDFNYLKNQDLEIFKEYVYHTRQNYEIYKNYDKVLFKEKSLDNEKKTEKQTEKEYYLKILKVDIKNFHYAIGLFKHDDINLKDNEPVYLQLITHDINFVNNYKINQTDEITFKWYALSQNHVGNVVNLFLARLKYESSRSFDRDLIRITEDIKALYSFSSDQNFYDDFIYNCNLVVNESKQRYDVYIIESEETKISIVEIREIHVKIDITPNTYIRMKEKLNMVWFINSNNNTNVCFEFDSRDEQVHFYETVHGKIMRYYLNFDLTLKK